MATHLQEVTPSHSINTNISTPSTNVAMHEMFVCLPISLCPAQFMCDPRVFTARLDRSRVGALTICGSVLQAANMLSALQPNAASANVNVGSNNNNKVNNNTTATNAAYASHIMPAPPPPPPPGPPPAPARLPLASSQNASIPLHSVMQTSKHTTPHPPPPPPGVPSTINGMANQHITVMRPQGR